MALVVVVALVAWVVYLQVNSGRSERNYTKSKVTQFEYLADSDMVLGTLTPAQRAGLVRPAENACTYRLDGHSEAQMIHQLETVGGVPASQGPSVAALAITALCPTAG